MKARLALCWALLATMVMLVPAPAKAHEVKVFQACATFTKGANYCLTTITVVRGDTVFFRCKLKPSHAGKNVILQHQNPGRTQWNDDGPVTLSDGGRAKASWTTGAGDADDNDPYHFRFKLEEAGHSHGISNILSIWVLKP
jgi:hypothetical protein